MWIRLLAFAVLAWSVKAVLDSLVLMLYDPTSMRLAYPLNDLPSICSVSIVSLPFVHYCYVLTVEPI